MIVIIDYGMGNLGSIHNMLKKIGVEASISSDPLQIEKAKKLIIPGVGSFENGVNNIFNLNLMQVLNEKVIEDKIPTLGICLGMQLFSKRSEEGDVEGFGWIDAETKRFAFEKDDESSLKIPHMGWNSIKINKQDSIFENIYENNRFYFIHSYHLICNQEENILAKTFYGYDFASIVRKENIVGVQFHPEKSHKYGMQLLKNFVENG